MIDLTYIVLMAAVTSCFLIKHKATSTCLCTLSIIIGWFQKIVDMSGIAAIIIFYAATYLCFHKEIKSKAIKGVLLTIVLLMTACFLFHTVPGFDNVLVVNKVAISPMSYPFTMYLNFDKAIAGLILFLNSGLYEKEKLLDRSAMIATAKILFLCSSVIMSIAMLSGYIKLDFKVPDILLIWSINNLLLVCLSEEVVFRGVIQEQLASVFRNKYVSLILSAIIFGMVHFQGGIPFILLATIAGLFYGLSYQKTGRVLSSMLVHFSLNITHLILFTYPAAIVIS